MALRPVSFDTAPRPPSPLEQAFASTAGSVIGQTLLEPLVRRRALFESNLEQGRQIAVHQAELDQAVANIPRVSAAQDRADIAAGRLIDYTRPEVTGAFQVTMLKPSRIAIVDGKQYISSEEYAHAAQMAAPASPGVMAEASELLSPFETLGLSGNARAAAALARSPLTASLAPTSEAPIAPIPANAAARYGITNWPANMGMRNRAGTGPTRMDIEEMKALAPEMSSLGSALIQRNTELIRLGMEQKRYLASLISDPNITGNGVRVTTGPDGKEQYLPPNDSRGHVRPLNFEEMIALRNLPRAEILAPRDPNVMRWAQLGAALNGKLTRLQGIDQATLEARRAGYQGLNAFNPVSASALQSIALTYAQAHALKGADGRDIVPTPTGLDGNALTMVKLRPDMLDAYEAFQNYSTMQDYNNAVNVGAGARLSPTALGYLNYLMRARAAQSGKLGDTASWYNPDAATPQELMNSPLQVGQQRPGLSHQQLSQIGQRTGPAAAQPATQQTGAQPVSASEFAPSNATAPSTQAITGQRRPGVAVPMVDAEGAGSYRELFNGLYPAFRGTKPAGEPVSGQDSVAISQRYNLFRQNIESQLANPDLAVQFLRRRGTPDSDPLMQGLTTGSAASRNLVLQGYRYSVTSAAENAHNEALK